MAYQSPYLSGAFGSDKITVTVGALKRVLDFAAEGFTIGTAKTTITTHTL